MRLIRKLLGKHVSAVQLVGFFLTNLVGVAIVLTAVQVYRDARPVVGAPDSFLNNDYLIISKHVEGASVGKTFFSKDEIDRLASQPFTEEIGEFSAARYKITGGVSFGGMGFTTDLFFESVPDRFLDVTSDEWHFAEGDRTIPIVLPKNYLNLYNFGFASTQGLPQLSEELIGRITLDIEVRGNGRQQPFTGRVVAFSNRLNTILVPESFITWSNGLFADSRAADPARLIIEVRNPADENLLAYLRSHAYEIEGDQNAGRANYFLRMVTGVVMGVGVLITALSFFILMLSIFLLLQKNTKKLEDLLLLGYTPAQVSRPYQMLTLALNLAVLALAVPAVLWVRTKYAPHMGMLTDSYHPAGIGMTILAGLAITTAVTLINSAAIRHKVNRLWHHG